MRQVLTVVAMNFADTLQLKRFIKKIFQDLQPLPSRSYEVRFVVNKDDATISSGIEASVGWFPHFQEEEVPKGVSAADWAQLIVEELTLLLLVSSKFVLKSVNIVEEGIIDIYIEKC